MTAKILVVEDNLDMRELLHLYLTMTGFDVLTAYDGREGLYMARMERPALITTDLNMPEMNGLTFIKELRADPQFKDVPIIAFTAYGNEEIKKAIQAGANLALDKPTNFEMLISDINKLLKERKQQ